MKSQPEPKTTSIQLLRSAKHNAHNDEAKRHIREALQLELAAAERDADA